MQPYMHVLPIPQCCIRRHPLCRGPPHPSYAVAANAQCRPVCFSDCSSTTAATDNTHVEKHHDQGVTCPPECPAWSHTLCEKGSRCTLKHSTAQHSLWGAPFIKRNAGVLYVQQLQYLARTQLAMFVVAVTAWQQVKGPLPTHQRRWWASDWKSYPGCTGACNNWVWQTKPQPILTAEIPPPPARHNHSAAANRHCRLLLLLPAKGALCTPGSQATCIYDLHIWHTYMPCLCDRQLHR